MTREETGSRVEEGVLEGFWGDFLDVAEGEVVGEALGEAGGED